MLDSLALDHNLTLIKKVKHDLVEVLPGLTPSVIMKIHIKTIIPVIAGGLITTK
ncbi:glycerol-3-phosphate responsive antiterminator [Oceanobacillus halotolerans]|uniref:glycerol-3-phosphate responsive antiterminator n=1 Tax=Oceanobacillus halotolerans TaxID=2663380 RepID=UPI0021F68750|nr:glycerol-3-phosphate responsive antiterminator [Oceanobacillus halotolerans]